MTEQQPDTIKSLNELLSQLKTYLILAVDQNDKIVIAASGSRRDLTACVWQLLKQDPSFGDIFMDSLMLFRGSDLLYRDSGEMDEYIKEVSF